MTTTNRPRYLSCADTAKLLRKALKKAFPTTRFSVRSDVYSGGASIDVRWIDGPSVPDVEAITAPFAGGGFDGMIDMAYNKRSWLLPDGTAAYGSSIGTEGSRGVHPAYDHEAPHPDAELVSFGADFIFTNRSYSEPVFRETLEAVATEYGVATDAEIGTWKGPFKGTTVVTGLRSGNTELPNNRYLSNEVHYRLHNREVL